MSDWRGWWRARDVLVRDGAVALALVALTLLPGTGHLGAAIGDLPVRRLDAWGVLLGGLLTVPLVVRRRFPAWCLPLVGGAFAGYELAGYGPTFATLGCYVALFSAGAYLERWRPWVAVAATVAYANFTIGLHHRGSPQRPGDYLLFFLALAACWAAGSWLRGRRRAERADQEASVAAAMGRERARIARELHDIVTHHVTAMVVQADATQYLVTAAVGQPPPGRATPDTPALDKVTAGLDAIGETGRRALADLRDLLAVLRAPEPEAAGQRSPTLSQLAELVDRTRAAGQPVELVEEGTPRPGSDGLELAAYRIVQESLTNALKHAPGQPTVLRVGHLPTEIRIEVTTVPTCPASGDPAAARDGAPARRVVGRHGHGLLGLAERVNVYGGTLDAGPTAQGGFRVRATLPRAGAR